MSETEGLVWKARFIVTQDGGVDLPHDRQYVEGPAEGRDEFLGKLAEVMPPATLFGIIKSKLKAGEIRTREAAEVVILDGTYAGARWLITGNSNASAGYFYVEARMPERPDAAFQEAREEFARAEQAMEAAAIHELARIIHETQPDAIEATVHGQYTDDGDLSIELTAVKTPEYVLDEELIEQLDEEARDALRYLIVTMQDAYLGENEIGLVDATEYDCPICKDAGYLLNQGYGPAEIPPGWSPVQCCDSCRKLPDDEAAVKQAAKDKRVAYRFFDPKPDEHDDGDDPGPGDYAIQWEEAP